jgi:Asp-tRNA(Asn)/Glu-tRNA(Gln) amidotransferase A subunit family amidase
MIWTPDLGHFPVEREVREIAAAAVMKLEGAGWTIDPDPLHLPNPWEIYLPTFWADLSVCVREVLDGGTDDLLPDVQAELAPVKHITLGQHVEALQKLRSFQARFCGLFDHCDVLAMPATAVAAFPHDHAPSRIDGKDVVGDWTSFMPFSVVANMTGCPAVTVPCGLTEEGLPVGTLLIADLGRDDQLLLVAEELAVATGFQPGIEPTSTMTPGS